MPAEPHVLHVFSSTGLYGAEYAVLGLMPALAKAGIASSLACIDNPHTLEQPLHERATAQGLHSERLACSKRLDYATIHALHKLIARQACTIVHVHGYKAAFYATRARGGSTIGTPIVTTLHGWVTNTRRLRFYRWLELRMLRRFQRVCIVSEAMRATLLHAGVVAQRIRLVENGIDTARFGARRHASNRLELGIPSDAFVFGSMLRMSAEKNPLGLIDAFATIARDAPHAWLVVAGDGPLRADAERRIGELGLRARVRLLGARNDPECVYPLFDCFVLPSLTEGLPLALLEAMACERPVIASDVGQIATVLENLPAQLVPAGDPAALTTAMCDAMGRRPPVPVLRQRVEARYSVTCMARDYAAVYRELVDQHGHLVA